MILKKLKPSQHREGCWLVWLEDGSLFRIGERDVIALGLYQGRELSPTDMEALMQTQADHRLSQRAIHMLSTRPMSRKELVGKLSAASPAGQREQLESVAEAVADRMEELGLLNESQYAHTVVRYYAARGYGEKKIRTELYRRGVPRDAWEEALAQLSQEGDSLRPIDQLVHRKMGGAEPSRALLKKVSDYLARRGFGWEEISSALARYADRVEE